MSSLRTSLETLPASLPWLDWTRHSPDVPRKVRQHMLHCSHLSDAPTSPVVANTSSSTWTVKRHRCPGRATSSLLRMARSVSAAAFGTQQPLLVRCRPTMSCELRLLSTRTRTTRPPSSSCLRHCRAAVSGAWPLVTAGTTGGLARSSSRPGGRRICTAYVGRPWPACRWHTTPRPQACQGASYAIRCCSMKTSLCHCGSAHWNTTCAITTQGQSRLRPRTRAAVYLRPLSRHCHASRGVCNFVVSQGSSSSRPKLRHTLYSLTCTQLEGPLSDSIFAILSPWSKGPTSEAVSQSFLRVSQPRTYRIVHFSAPDRTQSSRRAFSSRASQDVAASRRPLSSPSLIAVSRLSSPPLVAVAASRLSSLVSRLSSLVSRRRLSSDGSRRRLSSPSLVSRLSSLVSRLSSLVAVSRLTALVAVSRLTARISPSRPCPRVLPPTPSILTALVR